MRYPNAHRVTDANATQTMSFFSRHHLAATLLVAYPGWLQATPPPDLDYTPGNVQQICYTAALRAAEQSGGQDSSIAACRTAVQRARTDEDRAVALNNMALLMHAQQRTAEARQQIAEAVRIAPDNVAVRMNHVLLNATSDADAVATLSNLIENNPTHASYFNRGVLRARLGDQLGAALDANASNRQGETRLFEIMETDASFSTPENSFRESRSGFNRDRRSNAVPVEDRSQ